MRLKSIGRHSSTWLSFCYAGAAPVRTQISPIHFQTFIDEIFTTIVLLWCSQDLRLICIVASESYCSRTVDCARHVPVIIAACSSWYIVEPWLLTGYVTVLLSCSIVSTVASTDMHAATVLQYLKILNGFVGRAISPIVDKLSIQIPQVSICLCFCLSSDDKDQTSLAETSREKGFVFY